MRFRKHLLKKKINLLKPKLKIVEKTEHILKKTAIIENIHTIFCILIIYRIR